MSFKTFRSVFIKHCMLLTGDSRLMGHDLGSKDEVS